MVLELSEESETSTVLAASSVEPIDSQLESTVEIQNHQQETETTEERKPDRL